MTTAHLLFAEKPIKTKAIGFYQFTVHTQIVTSSDVVLIEFQRLIMQLIANLHSPNGLFYIMIESDKTHGILYYDRKKNNRLMYIVCYI